MFLTYHFSLRVWPGIIAPASHFEFTRSLPYLFAVAAIFGLWYLRRNRIASYQEFLRNSPGLDLNTKGIDYGIGHPTDPRIHHPENS